MHFSCIWILNFQPFLQIVQPGTLTSGVAHIITAVIGSGVLSLAWSTSQLGWIGGPISLLFFAIVTYISSFLTADCYRNSDSKTGKRNYTYTEAVRAYLGTSIALTHQLFLFPLNFRSENIDMDTTKYAVQCLIAIQNVELYLTQVLKAYWTRYCSVSEVFYAL